MRNNGDLMCIKQLNYENYGTSNNTDNNVRNIEKYYLVLSKKVNLSAHLKNKKKQVFRIFFEI